MHPTAGSSGPQPTGASPASNPVEAGTPRHPTVRTQSTHRNRWTLIHWLALIAFCINIEQCVAGKTHFSIHGLSETHDLAIRNAGVTSYYSEYYNEKKPDE